VQVHAVFRKYFPVTYRGCYDQGAGSEKAAEVGKFPDGVPALYVFSRKKRFPEHMMRRWCLNVDILQ
jgi:hypothetical protein